MTYITLAIAVSFDSFTVGLIYGMRRIQLGPAPLLLIMCQSAMVVYIAMIAGTFLGKIIPTASLDWLGSLVLILLGSWMLTSLIRDSRRTRAAPKDSTATVSPPRAQTNTSGPKIGPGGTLADSRAPHSAATGRYKQPGNPREPAHILSRPETADTDASGSISLSEAFFLGLALALDAFGAGIAAALLHYSALWMPLIVATFTGVFLTTGLTTGRGLAKYSFLRRLVYAPPTLLIALGATHLLT